MKYQKVISLNEFINKVIEGNKSERIKLYSIYAYSKMLELELTLELLSNIVGFKHSGDTIWIGNLFVGFFTKNKFTSSMKNLQDLIRDNNIAILMSEDFFTKITENILIKYKNDKDKN